MVAAEFKRESVKLLD